MKKIAICFYFRDVMTCSALCLKDEQCENFAIIKEPETKKADCKSIQNCQKLVKTSTTNPNKLEIFHNKFSKSNGDLTTHFLLINMENEVQDISLDKEKSPGLEYLDISFEGKVSRII